MEVTIFRVEAYRGKRLGIRTNWLAGRVKKINKEQLAGKEKDLLELCLRYKFRW